MYIICSIFLTIAYIGKLSQIKVTRKIYIKRMGIK